MILVWGSLNIMCSVPTIPPLCVYNNDVCHGLNCCVPSKIILWSSNPVWLYLNVAPFISPDPISSLQMAVFVIFVIKYIFVICTFRNTQMCPHLLYLPVILSHEGQWLESKTGASQGQPEAAGEEIEGALVSSLLPNPCLVLAVMVVGGLVLSHGSSYVRVPFLFQNLLPGTIW